MSAPYRDSDPPPRYLCIVCWKTASPVEGVCCGVPMPEIDVEELRKRARAKKAQPERRRIAIVCIVAAILAVGLHVALIVAGVYQLPARSGGWGRRSGAGGVAVVVFATFLVFFVALFYVTRRPIGADIDPDTASVAELVRWLGLDCAAG